MKAMCAGLQLRGGSSRPDRPGPAQDGTEYAHCPRLLHRLERPRDRSCACEGRQDADTPTPEGNDHEPDL